MSQSFLQTTVDKFIFKIQTDYQYVESGLWFAVAKDSGLVRIGLTDYVQQANGDVAFVTLPEPGDAISSGGELATIETVKVDLEVPSPLDGEVIAVNEALEDAPELINQDPYGRGWLLELRPAHWPVDGLLDAEQYLAVMTAQAEAEAAK